MAEKKCKYLCVDEQEIFIRNLKRLMSKHKMTQIELAERIDSTNSILSRVLTGKTIPSFGFISLICREFNVTFKDLFNPNKEEVKELCDNLLEVKFVDNKTKVIVGEWEEIEQIKTLNIDFRKKTIEVVVKFDELSVR